MATVSELSDWSYDIDVLHGDAGEFMGVLARRVQANAELTIQMACADYWVIT
jgi:hypothetical protein